jgi:hypothetical protein
MKKLYTLLLLTLSLTINAQYSVDFEAASKGSYASGTVDLNSINWDMTEALIGTSASDFYNGAKSARLRGYGTSSMTMLADKSNGLGQISFQYRQYGTDAQVSWKVEYSTNAGGAWTQAGSIFTATGTVQNFVATVNVTGNVRIRIVRDTNDGATANKRMNIDDILLQDFTGTPMPALTITSPANSTVYAPNVTSVNVTLNVANFNVANGTGDGHIHYQVTKDATPQGVVMKYDTTPIALTGLTPGSYSVYVELVDNSHNPIAPAVNATVTFVISSYTVVADLAALRADVIANGAGKYYQVSSNPVITYARSSTYRNQKYVQDSSAGILIDDVPGTISTTMVSGDAISGLRGQTSLFSGVLQLLPIENATVATSGNTVTPQVVTIANITGNIEAYESELVQINTVSFVEAGGNFAAASNYTLDDTANTLAFRTNFAEANYIGSLIPAGTQNVVVLVGEFNGTAQVTARNVTDMPLGTNSFNAIDGLRMYPNPLSGNVLNFNTTANAELDIQIFDILGKQVLTSKVLNNSLNVNGLNAGIYIVKITEEGKTATRKLVVK